MIIDADLLRSSSGIGEFDFRLCTKNDIAVADKCIQKGTIYVKSFYKAADRLEEFDLMGDDVTEIILDRVKFELYVKGKMFEDSEKCRIECQSKLIVRLGEVANVYKKDEVGSGVKPFGLVVKKSPVTKVNWDGY